MGIEPELRAVRRIIVLKFLTVNSFLTNRAWWIRHYSRPAARIQRQASVLALGLVVRQAFSATDDFEALLRALADALAGAWPPQR
jgi:hypothetical protein